jgi:enamine deaminase RidA (YjgF/YER057c/UK114 family)
MHEGHENPEPRGKIGQQPETCDRRPPICRQGMVPDRGRNDDNRRSRGGTPMSDTFVRPLMRAAVKHNGVVYLAGQVAYNRPGAPIREQTQDTLAGIDKLLHDNGSNKSKILSAQVWLVDMNDYNAMNEVWNAWVDPKAPPPRACVQATLARPEYRVEIMVIAAA